MSDQAKLTLTGRIVNITPVTVYGTFEKREVWIKEETDEYPQTYPIEFTKEKMLELDRYKIGDVVECRLNLRGRTWEKDGREGCMVSLGGWVIKLVTPSTETPTQAATQQQAMPATADNDLPF